jgi:hypothetical protein
VGIFGVLQFLIVTPLGGCAFTQDSEPFGWVWQSTLSPMGSGEGKTSVVPSRAGVACKYQGFGLIAWGDNSVGSAKTAGVIKGIASIDKFKEGSPILATGRTCTVIKGHLDLSNRSLCG